MDWLQPSISHSGWVHTVPWLCWSEYPLSQLLFEWHNLPTWANYGKKNTHNFYIPCQNTASEFHGNYKGHHFVSISKPWNTESVCVCVGYLTSGHLPCCCFFVMIKFVTTKKEFFPWKWRRLWELACGCDSTVNKYKVQDKSLPGKCHYVPLHPRPNHQCQSCWSSPPPSPLWWPSWWPNHMPGIPYSKTAWCCKIKKNSKQAARSSPERIRNIE